MKYFCTECSYSYDDALGDIEEEVDPGEVLDKCPSCEEYDSFHGLDEEVNYITDGNMGALEIDHIPEVEIKDGKLKVTIANEIHPMGESHRIATVALYDEYGDLVHTNYLELENEAVTEFDFDDLDEFEIRVKCSLHGVWGKKFVN